MFRTTLMTLVAMVLVFSSPAQAKEKVRIDATFRASEFNSFASAYMERPTFLELIVRKNKPNQLYIYSDFIRKSEATIKGFEFVSLSESAVEDYIAAIDKYFSWEQIAIQDGDIIDKEITKVMGRKKSVKLKFGFYSSNAKSHYLTMQSCAVGICLEPALVFDFKNAKLLKKTLESWKAGQLQGITAQEVDDKYK